MRQSGSPARDVLRLAAGLAIVAIVWGGLLPRLLDWGPVARHIELMEARGVDPSAIYYTELERLPLRPAWVEDRLVLWP
ncbi:MAG: hypothetical protein O3C39_13150 [Planctomycetota bacterium]|jgi:hypothetical protein|nr:hypothetical protein [Planctomycetota bacterium]MDA1202615.1 hypothetical protein [Planctomycetota bacterium]